MKKNKFIYTLSLLLMTLVLGFSACSDDDDNKGGIRLDVFGPSPALRGGELRFIGQGLDRVTAVVLSENVEVTTIEKTSSNEISIVVPEATRSGYTVTLKTPEGDIISKTTLTISEPISITKFYKKGAEGNTSVAAGDVLVFEGEYLNLIREVVFMNNVVVSLEREEGEEYPRDKFEVKVPIAAQTGPVSLSNGAEIPILVDTETPLTVATASVSSIAPKDVAPEQEITIKGDNLHLVKAVRFNPSLDVEVPQGTDPFAVVKELKVKVPGTAQDGDVTLILYSGLEVVAGQITMTTPSITSVTAEANVGETVTVNGKNLNLIQSLKWGNTTISSFTQHSATTMKFVVPKGASLGNHSLVAVSATGSEYPAESKIEITNVEPIAAGSLVWPTFDKGVWSTGWNSIGEFVTEGKRTYYKGSAGNLAGKWTFAGNDGLNLPECPDVNAYVLKADMKIVNDFKPGAYKIQMCISKQWGWCESGFFPLAADGVTASTGGGWVTMTWALPTLGLNGPSIPGGSTDTGLFMNETTLDWSNVYFANFRYEKK